jgi:hypothetical protein
MFYIALKSLALVIGSLFVTIAGNCSIATVPIMSMAVLGKRESDRTYPVDI